MMPFGLARGNRKSRYGSVCRAAVIVFVAFALSSCSEMTGRVQDSVDRAIAPVREATDEAARRVEEVQKGVLEVQNGVSRVRGALSGSGQGK